MREDYYNDLNNFLDYSKRRRWQWQFFLDFITFAVTIVVAYYVFSFSALNLRFNYLFARHESPTITASTDNTQSGSADAGDDNQTITNPTVSVPSDMPASGIYISKIDVKAPITWNGNSDNTQELLKKGVVHIEGSAMPGVPGNVFITGHSSDLPWAEGDYKTVFALLDKVENGDEIVIRNQGQDLVYKVYNKQVVNKDEVGNYITSDKSQSLTIMTCYPVGSNWKRLIVQAERQGL